MPEIDMVEVEKQSAKKKDEVQTITAKVVDGKTYFYSKFLNKSYSDYGEANAAESAARQVADYKKQGRNEIGQTPEDAKKASIIKGLLAEKEEILKQLQAVDIEIQLVKRGETSKASKKK